MAPKSLGRAMDDFGDFLRGPIHVVVEDEVPVMPFHLHLPARLLEAFLDDFLAFGAASADWGFEGVIGSGESNKSRWRRGLFAKR